MKLVDVIGGWAARYTRRGRYSPVGQAFHWIMAALVFFQLWWGWRLGRLPVGPDKLEAYALHSQIGIVLLLIIVLRGLWRLEVPGPETEAEEPGWERTAAHATHYAFYGILIALPLSGWLMWSAMASEYPLFVVGAPWPLLPVAELSPEIRWRILRLAVVTHAILYWALSVLIALHVGAALKRHFIDRDGVLASMVPFLEPLRPHRAAAPRIRTPQPSPDLSEAD